METSQPKTVPITERLRNIKIGSYTVDHGSHTKHIAVRAICEEAAAEIERLRKLDIELRGECVLLADVLRDAFEVVKTVEGEEQDECDKLTGLCLSIAHALALYDDELWGGCLWRTDEMERGRPGAAELYRAQTPMTDAEIAALLPTWQRGSWTLPDYGRWVARAVERAHGIKAKPNLCRLCGHEICSHDRQYGCSEDGCDCETPNV